MSWCNTLLGHSVQYVGPVAIYTVFQKNQSLAFSSYTLQIVTDFQSSFTSTFCAQLAIWQLLDIPPQLNCVATLPCEM